MSEPFVGEIILVGFPWAPINYASCDGTLMSIPQFSAMFALLGTYFGGNGTTNFALPDLRGRVPVCQGQRPGAPAYQIGTYGGAESIGLTQNQLPAHTHAAATVITALTAPSAKVPSPAGNLLTAGATSSNPPVLCDDYAAPGTGTSAAMAPGMATTTLQPTGLGQPVSVLQPYQAINYVIATAGIFPSRP